MNETRRIPSTGRNSRKRLWSRIFACFPLSRKVVDSLHRCQFTRLARLLGSSIYVCLFDIFGVRNNEGGTQTPGQSYLMEKYHIGFDLASAGLSFYVLGLASGPLICGCSYFTMIIV